MDGNRLLKNPCKAHRTVKPPKRTKKKARAWDRSTADAVRAGLRERYRFAVDIGLGLGLGLRQGEAFGLSDDDFDFQAMVVHVRRQLRWDSKGRPYFCLPKGGKSRTVPLCPNIAARARSHMRHFPPVSCTLPWRNPEPPATDLERRQRAPMAVRLVLSTSAGNRIHYKTWNERSWKPALVKAQVLKVVGERVQRYGGRTRTHPLFDVSRADMFHVLRHTYASVQLEAGESVVSLSEWLGHASPNITLDHYAHFMPGAGRRGVAAMDAWLAPAPRRKVPQKSLGVPWTVKLPANAQLTAMLKQTADKRVKYKETARGGLAVNVIEC